MTTRADRVAVYRARDRLMARCGREPKLCAVRVFGWDETAETEIKCQSCGRTQTLRPTHQPQESPMQYVQITFTPDGTPYTYHNEGEPVAVGDKVEVRRFNSKKAVAVEVVGVTDQAPQFDTKPILRRVPQPPTEERKAELAAGAEPRTTDETKWLDEHRVANPNDSLAGL